MRPILLTNANGKYKGQQVAIHPNAIAVVTPRLVGNTDDGTAKFVQEGCTVVLGSAAMGLTYEVEESYEAVAKQWDDQLTTADHIQEQIYTELRHFNNRNN